MITPTQETVTLAFAFGSSQVLCAEHFHLLSSHCLGQTRNCVSSAMKSYPGPVICARLWEWAIRAGEVALVEHLGRFPTSTWLVLQFYMIQSLLLDPAGTAHMWYTLRQVGTRTYT